LAPRNAVVVTLAVVEHEKLADISAQGDDSDEEGTDLTTSSMSAADAGGVACFRAATLMLNAWYSVAGHSTSMSSGFRRKKHMLGLESVHLECAYAGW